MGIRRVNRHSGGVGFGFFRSENVSSGQFAPLTAVHFSFFGFHSRANFCASAIRAGAILEAMNSRFLGALPLHDLPKAHPFLVRQESRPM